MKKIVSVLLATLMLTAITGCGSSQASSSAAPESTSSIETSSASSSDADKVYEISFGTFYAPEHFIDNEKTSFF